MAFLVDPDDGVGTDYLTINALMVAETGNMSGEVVTLKSTAGSADTVTTVLDEDGDSYSFIVDPDHRHNGTYETDKWRMEFTVTSGQSFVVHGNVKFEGFQFKVIAASGSPLIVAANGDWSDSLQEFYECLFVANNTGSATSIEGIFTVENFNSNVVKVKNCAFWDFDFSSGRGTYAAASITMYLHNCTAYNCTIGFRGAVSTNYAMNCCTNDCTDGFNGDFEAASDYNCSDISSDAPGGNSQTGEVAFVDEGARDLHLAVGDTVAQGNGTDLSGNSDLPVTLDVDGDSRHASAPDIGFDEYAPGATIDQEGFRFRNDDDNEADATWKEDQDTVVSSLAKDTNVRLRMLLNATGDPATHQFKLQYRQKGDAATEWRDV